MSVKAKIAAAAATFALAGGGLGLLGTLSAGAATPQVRFELPGPVLTGVRPPLPPGHVPRHGRGEPEGHPLQGLEQ